MLFVFDSQLFNNNGAIDGWNFYFRCHRINNKKNNKKLQCDRLHLYLSVSSFLVVYFKIIWPRTEFMGDLSFQEATRSHSNLRLSSLARHPWIRNPWTGSYDRYDGNLIPVTAKHSNAKSLNTLGWQRSRTRQQSPSHVHDLCSEVAVWLISKV